MRYVMTIIFGFFSVFLAWCTTQPLAVDLPEVFSVLPDGFDQLLYIDVDDQVLGILEAQYGEQTPVVLEFAKMESLVLRQSSSIDGGSTMLFIYPKPWSEINLNQLNVLWILPTDPSYEVRNMGDIIIYAQTSLYDQLLFDGAQDQLLISSLQSADFDRNILFVSTPIDWQTWRVAQFANKLQWTIVSARISTWLPTGKARLLFDDWFVPRLSSSDTREASWSSTSPIHISAHSLSSLFGIQPLLLESFLPLILPQFVWGSLSLLNSDDYRILVDALWGTVSLDLVPSIVGRWGRMSLQTSDVYALLDKIYPALDGFIKSQPSVDDATSIITTKEQSLMSRSTSFAVWDGSDEIVTLPLLRASQTSDTTSIEYLMLTDLPNIDTTNTNLKTTYPLSTLAVWTIDFDILSEILPALSMIWGQATLDTLEWSMLTIEVSADHDQDQIVIEFGEQ